MNQFKPPTLAACNGEPFGRLLLDHHGPTGHVVREVAASGSTSETRRCV